MSKYFNAFPSASYANTIVTNVVLRVKLNNYVKKNGVLFYPYTITDDDRADQIAYYYYDDSFYAWLVYLSNNVVDPYFQWPLDSASLENFIKKKYGSISAAQSKVEYYRTNWYNSETTITVSTYNALAVNLKKFWEPIVSDAGQIVSYQRKKTDLFKSTNKSVNVTIDITNLKSFSVGERVSFVSSSAEVATGEVVFANTTALSVVNTTGTISSNGVYSLVGGSSLAECDVSSVDLIVDNIPANEIDYWTSVTAYEKEIELNEQKKHIVLIDKAYKENIYQELENLLNE